MMPQISSTPKDHTSIIWMEASLSCERVVYLMMDWVEFMFLVYLRRVNQEMIIKLLETVALIWQ